jgi:hypothetical protein
LATPAGAPPTPACAPRGVRHVTRGFLARARTQRDAAVAKQEELYEEYARLDALVAAGGLS